MEYEETLKMVKRKPTKWNIHLMKVYKEMKKEDDTTKLLDAMKKAKTTYTK